MFARSAFSRSQFEERLSKLKCVCIEMHGAKIGIISETSKKNAQKTPKRRASEIYEEMLSHDKNQKWSVTICPCYVVMSSYAVRFG